MLCTGSLIAAATATWLAAHVVAGSSPAQIKHAWMSITGVVCRLQICRSLTAQWFDSTFRADSLFSLFAAWRAPRRPPSTQCASHNWPLPARPCQQEELCHRFAHLMSLPTAAPSRRLSVCANFPTAHCCVTNTDASSKVEARTHSRVRARGF